MARFALRKCVAGCAWDVIPSFLMFQVRRGWVRLTALGRVDPIPSRYPDRLIGAHRVGCTPVEIPKMPKRHPVDQDNRHNRHNRHFPMCMRVHMGACTRETRSTPCGLQDTRAKLMGLFSPGPTRRGWREQAGYPCSRVPHYHS